MIINLIDNDDYKETSSKNKKRNREIFDSGKPLNLIENILKSTLFDRNGINENSKPTSISKLFEAMISIYSLRTSNDINDLIQTMKKGNDEWFKIICLRANVKATTNFKEEIRNILIKSYEKIVIYELVTKETACKKRKS